jgi:hydrogenase maturation factor HypF (carbamoyltransferase family)
LARRISPPRTPRKKSEDILVEHQKTIMTHTCICTHCQSPLEAPTHYLGQSVKCPACREDFIAAVFVDPDREKSEKTRKGCIGCLVALVVFGGLGILIGLTTEETSPAERKEKWRQQKIENERVKNYIENIKPYVPAP